MENSPVGQAYDVVVIGAGHNGLVAAAYLAKAGQRVLVLEARPEVGGAASTEPVFPGYRANTGASDAGLFRPEIERDLNLDAHGLRWIENPALVFAPQLGGASLTLWRDPARSAAEIASFSPPDAARYLDFHRLVSRLAEVLGVILRATPPPLPELRGADWRAWSRAALRLKSLGDREMMEFLRLLPMPVVDFLEEWFASPALKAALGAVGVSGSFLGPRGAGTTFMLLYQAIGAGQAGVRASRFVEGGSGALSQALARAAEGYGVEVCTGLAVEKILLDDGRAVGVRLASGRSIAAQAVVSSSDPQRTFFGLVGGPNLEVRFVREVKNLRLRSSLARLNLALDGLPGFATCPQAAAEGRLAGHILICPDLDYLERAYDTAKYGRLPDHPMLDMTLPTLADPGLAPPGKHLLSIDAYYVPYSLQGNNWEAGRETLLAKVLETLEAYAPGLSKQVEHSQVLTPPDLEQHFGLTQGDVYHGQMGLDQLLMMRPVPGYLPYQTPIAGLYLCGAGSHPGGGLTGAPGYQAARAIIKRLSSR